MMASATSKPGRRMWGPFRPSSLGRRACLEGDFATRCQSIPAILQVALDGKSLSFAANPHFGGQSGGWDRALLCQTNAASAPLELLTLLRKHPLQMTTRGHAAASDHCSPS